MRTETGSRRRTSWCNAAGLVAAAVALGGLIGVTAWAGSPPRKTKPADDPFGPAQPIAKAEAVDDPFGGPAQPEAKLPKPFEKVDAELFDKLDTNHDGKVTKDEFKAGLSTLRDAMNSAPFGGDGASNPGQVVGRIGGAPVTPHPRAHRAKPRLASPKVVKPDRDPAKQRRAAAQIIRFTDAAPAASPADKAAPKDLTEETYQQLLARKVEMDVAELPLDQFMARLAKAANRPVRADAKSLEELGIGEDFPVTVKAADVTLRSALTRMLRNVDPQLRLSLSDGAIWLTTAEAAQQEPFLRAYFVGDLLRREPAPVVRHGFHQPDDRASDDAVQELDDLTNLVKNSIEPVIWMDNGGEAEVKSAGNKTLLVSASRGPHDEVRDLFEALRAVRKAQAKGAAGQPQPVVCGDVNARDAALRLRAAFQQRVTLECKGKRLAEVVAELSKQVKFPIALDDKSLDELGVSPDTLVTIILNDVPLRTALRRMLRQIDPQLTLMLVDETLVITSKEGAQLNQLCIVYPVLDLTEPQGEAKRGVAADTLIEAIKGTTSPATWKDNGGEGDARVFKNCGALVVTQTAEVHEQVEDALAKLRAAQPADAEKAPQDRPDKDPKASQRPAADSANVDRRDAKDDVQTVIYHLSPTALRTAEDAKGKDRPKDKEEESSFVSEAEIKELKALILEQTGTDQWPAATTSIHRVGNNLVVRQCASLQHKIQDLFDELDVLEGEPTTSGLPLGFGGGGQQGGGGGFGGQFGGQPAHGKF